MPFKQTPVSQKVELKASNSHRGSCGGKSQTDVDLSSLSEMVGVRGEIPTALRVGVTCTDW